MTQFYVRCLWFQSVTAGLFVHEQVFFVKSTFDKLSILVCMARRLIKEKSLVSGTSLNFRGSSFTTSWNTFQFYLERSWKVNKTTGNCFLTFNKDAPLQSFKCIWRVVLYQSMLSMLWTDETKFLWTFSVWVQSCKVPNLAIIHVTFLEFLLPARHRDSFNLVFSLWW